MALDPGRLQEQASWLGKATGMTSPTEESWVNSLVLGQCLHSPELCLSTLEPDPSQGKLGEEDTQVTL